jgi:hypothetical protein
MEHEKVSGVDPEYFPPTVKQCSLVFRVIVFRFVERLAP